MDTEKKDESNEKKEKKEIKVINGDGSDLNISPVYEHITSDTPSYNRKKENIVIPKGSSNNSK